MSTRPTAWPTWASCPQVEWLLRHIDGRHQTLLFSATLDGVVDGLDQALPARSGAPRGRVRHRHRRRDDPPLPPGARDGQGEGGRRHRPPAPAARSSSRAPSAGADRLARALNEEGVKAAAIHGDLRQGQREQALTDFGAGKLAGAGRHRRRRPRPPHRRHRRRDPLRPARGPQGVPAPLRPHRPRRRERHGRHARRSGTRSSRSGACSGALGLGVPIVEMFSNDPRLARPGRLGPQAHEAVGASR